MDGFVIRGKPATVKRRRDCEPRREPTHAAKRPQAARPPVPVCAAKDCRVRGRRNARFAVRVAGTYDASTVFCNTHKTSEMVDTNSKFCEISHCNRIPSYGDEWKKPRCCVKHKEDGMEDVVNKKCECATEECKRQPSYGDEWMKPRFCAAHKEDGMEDVVNKRCECATEECKSLPVFGDEWKKPRFCAKHKEDGMENVVDNRCLACRTLVAADSTMFPYCLPHYVEITGRAPARFFKVKERVVIPFVQQAFSPEIASVPGFYIHPQKFLRCDDGKTYFTDVVIGVVGVVEVSIEPDEHGHRAYDVDDEAKKTRETLRLGLRRHRTVVHVRFDIDAKVGDRKHRAGFVSCWSKKTADGPPVVEKHREVAWASWLGVLEAVLRRILNGAGVVVDAAKTTAAAAYEIAPHPDPEFSDAEGAPRAWTCRVYDPKPLLASKNMFIK